jgi:hypothetical protein
MIISISLGPGSLSARSNSCDSASAVSTRTPGTPIPLASATQSRFGFPRLVSERAVGPGSVTPARASSTYKIR